MAPALALVALAGASASILALWPVLGAWSLACAPLVASVLTAGLAWLGAGAREREMAPGDVSVDEMVAALTSVLPERRTGMTDTTAAPRDDRHRSAG